MSAVDSSAVDKMVAQLVLDEVSLPRGFVSKLNPYGSGEAEVVDIFCNNIFAGSVYIFVGRVTVWVYDRCCVVCYDDPELVTKVGNALGRLLGEER